MSKTFWKVFGTAVLAYVVMKGLGSHVAPYLAKIPVVGPFLADLVA